MSRKGMLALIIVALLTVGGLAPFAVPAAADSSKTHETKADFDAGDTGTRTEVIGTGVDGKVVLGKSESWEMATPATTPKKLYAAAMAYDSVNELVVLFGGLDGSQYLDETWIYNTTNGTWYNPQPDPSPPKRYGGSMAFDEDDGVFVLFGGGSWGADTCGGYCSDTWLYNASNNTWTRKYPVWTPSGRYFLGMTYDQVRGEVIVFGGYGSGYSNALYRYNITTNSWYFIPGASAPQARYRMGFVYNPGNDTYLLFGGGAGGNYFGDTRYYNKTTSTWTDISPMLSPEGRYGHSMVWDSRLDKTFMFGGYAGSGGYQNDTWTFSLDTGIWKQVMSENDPGRIYSASMVHDTSEGVNVLYGGYISGVGYSSRTFLYGNLYRRTGNFTSERIDSLPGDTYVNWVNISWQGARNQGKVWLQISANDDGTSWYYTGPDGTILTAYTQSTGETIWSGHDGRRFLSYRLFLQASNPLQSPTVDNVTVVFNRAPMAPVLASPSHFEYVTTARPTFNLSSTELDLSDVLMFSIELSDDNFNTIERTFDQTIDPNGWSASEFASGQPALFTVPEGEELTNGRTYQWRAMAFDGRDWSESAVVWWFTVDTTPPEMPYSVSDGLAADLDFTGSEDTLSAHWDSAGDPESGVRSYWYAIGETQGGTEVLDWTDNGIRTAVTVSGLDLVHGATYYTAVKAENGAGVFSGVTVSDGQMVDTTAPTAPVVKDGGDFTYSSTELSAEWYSKDPESGIVENAYALGTEAGATDVVNWTSIGGANTIMVSELNMTEGDTYFISVKCRNNVGTWGPVGSSDGITVDTSPPRNLSLEIAGGTGYTNTSDVDLTISAADDISEVSEMRLSNDGSVWSGWISFDTTKGWSLSAGDGDKAVFLEVKDTAGNTAGGALDTIVLDTVRPSALNMRLGDGSGLANTTTVPLTLYSYDATSGVADMAFSIDGVAWGSWQAYSTTTTYTFSTGDGQRALYFKVRDRAGNVADPVNGTVTVDTAAPTVVTLVINDNEANTMNSQVVIRITAEDTTSGVSSVSLSNDGVTWSAWEPFATIRTWSLDTDIGVKKVYLRVRDGAGNVAGPVDDSIGFGLVTLDLKVTKPARGSKVSDIIKIAGTAKSDSKVSLIQVRIDGGPWKNATPTEQWSYDWDTRDYADGIHTIEVRAQDDLGFGYAPVIEVKVANRDEGEATSMATVAGTLLLAIATLVIGIVVGFVLGRGRGRKEGALPDDLDLEEHERTSYPDEEDRPHSGSSEYEREEE